MENYRPKNVNFVVESDNELVPNNLGEFETAEDAALFLSDNKIVAINEPLTANRHMDVVEKAEKRKEYSELLEDILPKFKKEHLKATQELSEAKENEKKKKELVNSTSTQIECLAIEVKKGIVPVNLDDKYTSRIAVFDKYYYYTYIDKQLKLCAIRDIPEHEKGEIFNQMATNNDFFNDFFGAESHKDSLFQKTLDECGRLKITTEDTDGNEYDITDKIMNQKDEQTKT